jgi:hypothetical protein
VISTPSRALSAVVLAASLTLTLAPTPARAQSPQNLQVAQALYDQATQEMAAKSYATACPKLEEAVRLVPEGVGGKLTLAECYEAAGKLASAWASYQLAEAAASRGNQADRQKLAHDRAAALRPKLAMLTITVTEPARSVPGLSIVRDGVPVGPTQWGLPLPADKGKHLITATVGDGRKWERAVEITDDGVRETVGIADLPGSAPTGTPALPPTATPAPAAPEAPAPGASSGRRTAGFALVGVGAASLVAGLAAGAVAMVKKNQSNADGHCDAANHCDPTGTDLRNGSLGAGNASTGLVVAGAVVLAGGVVLVVTAPSAPPAATTSLRLRVTPGGLSLAGTF